MSKGTELSSASQFVSNPHLKLLDNDMLFHIGIKVGDQNLRKLFGDVKVELLFCIRDFNNFWGLSNRKMLNFYLIEITVTFKNILQTNAISWVLNPSIGSPHYTHYIY